MPFKNYSLLKLAIGHALTPDLSNLKILEHAGKAHKAVTDEDVFHFLMGDIDKIDINIFSEGNSYQDLILTSIGFLLAENLYTGKIETNEELAGW